LQKLSLPQATERMTKMAGLWQQMHTEGNHKIHAEFGHFSSLEHFSLFEKYAVRNADSLGMNEVELQLVLDFWAGKVTDINASIDSSPNLEQVLELTKQFFKAAAEKKMNVSRVHLHPYGSFLICYDQSKWEDAYESIVKSSISVPKYCLSD